MSEMAYAGEQIRRRDVAIERLEAEVARLRADLAAARAKTTEMELAFDSVVDHHETEVAHLRGELAARDAHLAGVRSVLRDLCAAYGDNDWPEDLHLGDALDKHLGRHLDALTAALAARDGTLARLEDALRKIQMWADQPKGIPRDSRAQLATVKRLAGEALDTLAAALAPPGEVGDNG